MSARPGPPARNGPSPLYAPLKRGLDLLGAGVGLVILSPLLLAIAARIRLDDGGPVIYRRLVVGRGGRTFHAYKFRTMVVDADARLAADAERRRAYLRKIKLEDDPRVTQVGRALRRTSLDELPQLVNVLRGQMSLIGPRMIHPSEVARFGPFAVERQTVRPGITGLWAGAGPAPAWPTRSAWRWTASTWRGARCAWTCRSWSGPSAWCFPETARYDGGCAARVRRPLSGPSMSVRSGKCG